MNSNAPQGTVEWMNQRIGKVTASKIADLRASTKSGWGASRKNYMAQLLVERLTGAKQDSYSNAAMQWGTEKEPAARSAYEFYTDREVVEVGFINHPNIPMSGASPDGLVGEDGLIEIKCPNTHTHLDYLLTGNIPSKYIQQMHWQMLCTERKWCDFASFDPRLPVEMQLRIDRVELDAELAATIEKDVTQFLAELDKKLDELTTIYQKDKAA